MKVAEQIARRLRKPILPQDFAPWGAFIQDFVDVTAVPFTAAPGVIAWVTARSFKVDAQKRAVVRRFAIDSNNEVADLFVRWRFLINGQPLLNYQAPPVNFGLLSQPTEIWIQVEQENIIDLQVGTIDDTLTYYVATRVVLWTWDLKQHPRAEGD